MKRRHAVGVKAQVVKDELMKAFGVSDATVARIESAIEKCARVPQKVYGDETKEELIKVFGRSAAVITKIDSALAASKRNYPTYIRAMYGNRAKKSLPRLDLV